MQIAILATDGFEEVELTEPRKALKTAGHRVHIVSPGDQHIRSWRHGEWGDRFPVDRPLHEASASDYDLLVLPGGVINPDKLRLEDEAIGFIRAFGDADKPIAAICHGPWTLIDAGQVRGRRVTSWPSIRRDLENAGADWVDQEVVEDGPLITSRNPDDLKAFNATMIERLKKMGREAA